MPTSPTRRSLAAANDGGMFSVKDPAYGAYGNGKYLTDGAITTGTATFTSASAAFTAGDVGKKLAVAGATASAGVLATSISAYVNATTVTLANNAGTTVSGASFLYGTDDTTAINAAVTAAGALAQGGTVLLPAGVYITTNSINMLTKVSIVGVGVSKSVLAGVGNFTTAIILFNGSSGTLFQDNRAEDLEVDGTYTTQTSYNVPAQGIRLNWCLRPVVINCYVHDTLATCIDCIGCQLVVQMGNKAYNGGRGNDGTQGGGGGFGFSLGQANSNLEIHSISNCHDRLSNRFGFLFEYGSSGTSSQFRTMVNNCSADGEAVGFWDAGARRLLLNNCTAYNQTGPGIAVKSGTISGPVGGTEGVISNCTVFTAGTNGIEIDYSGTTGLGIYRIHKCAVKTSTFSGIALTANASNVFPTVIITDCDLYTNGRSGVWLSGAGGFSDVVIEGCRMMNNATATATAAYKAGISINSSITRAKISNNYITENSGAGKQLYGMIIASTFTVTSAQITQNYMIGNVTGPMLVSGTITTPYIANNPGMTFSDSAAASTAVTGPTTYTVLPTDSLLLVDTSGGAVTLALSGINPNTYFSFAVKDSGGAFGTSACTISRYGSEKIAQRAASLILSSNYGSYKFASNGTDWLKLSTATNRASQSFTASGTFTPQGEVAYVELMGMGGASGGSGGGGGGGGSTVAAAGGGAGGVSGLSQVLQPFRVAVTPGTAYTVTIGTGGPGGTAGTAGALNASGSIGGTGGTSIAGTDTTFGSLATFKGGGAQSGGAPGNVSAAGASRSSISGMGANTPGASGGGGAVATAGSSGSTATAQGYLTDRAPTTSTGGTTGGANGGGGGGGAGGVPAAQSGTAPVTQVGGAAGTAGNAGSAGNAGQAAGANTGFGGGGGSGGGGGGLLAVTGTAGGAGGAGGAGSDGLVVVYWLE